MGVYRLQSFVENGQPNAYCHEVSIEDLATRYSDQTGRQAVIVVDGNNFLYTFAYKSGDNDWLMGGQLDDCINNIKQYIARFQDIGVELIFFFDGATPTKRRQFWISRRAARLKRIQMVFKHLKGKLSIPPKKLQGLAFFQQPSLIGAMGRFMVKYACAAKIRIAIGDCDLDLATFAQKENHCAVLTQDMDFMIFEGSQYCLSAKHLNLKTMTTLLYNREEFAKEISVQLNHLPLLATLLGNDCLMFQHLEDYHARMVNVPVGETVNIHQLISALADYVRTLPTGDELIAMLPTIAAEHLQDASLTEALQDGVKSYLASSLCNDSFNDIEDSNWKNILKCAQERHIQCETPPTVYGILLGQPFELSQSMEDFSDRLFPCAAMAYRKLRSSIYSILLHEKPGTNTSVEEWCIYPYQRIEGKNIPVGELPVGVHHPGLLALWNGSTPDIQAQRWELFVQSVYPGLDTAQVRSLPLQLVIPTLVLSYIRREFRRVLVDWEVDAILSLAVVRDSTEMAALRTLPPVYLPPVRAVQCSTLYSRGITTVLLLGAACGILQEEMMAWHYFDGKLFFMKYLEAYEGSTQTFLCNQQPNLFKKFLKMRSIIFSTQSPLSSGDARMLHYGRRPWGEFTYWRGEPRPPSGHAYPFATRP